MNVRLQRYITPRVTERVLFLNKTRILTRLRLALLSVLTYTQPYIQHTSSLRHKSNNNTSLVIDASLQTDKASLIDCRDD